MDLQAISKAYQQAIRSKFPSAFAEAKQEGSLVVVDVFRIADAHGGSFMQFLLDELPEILGKEGVPLLPVTPYSESDTRTFFPALHEKLVRDEVAQSTSGR